MDRSGPVVIAFDGTEASQHAIRESGGLLSGRKALVVVVWKAGIGFELVAPGATAIGLPPAPLDVRTALEIDEKLAERAQQLAAQGADLARQAGYDAEGLAVAEDIDVPTSDTIASLAKERDAQAVVVGLHGHGGLGGVLLGPTSREIIRHSPAPVVVVRAEQPAS
jgi:nucleotide-binding universal stress UspA family protein